MDTLAASSRSEVRGIPGAERRRLGWLELALGGSLLVALAFRLHDLAGPSLWVDEIASWTFARLGWSNLLGPVAQAETNPPGFYVLLKLVIDAVGQGEFAMRLPSAVAGALAVIPVALVARRAGGPFAGAVAAALVSVSAVHIHHSQQARGYALLFLALAIALWLTGPMLRQDARGGRWIVAAVGFVLACLAALYLHATATIMVAAIYVHAFVVLVMRDGPLPRRELATLFATGVLILLGAAWWLRLAAGMVGTSASPVSWIQRPDLANTAEVMANVLGGFHFGRLKIVAAALGAVALAAAAVFAIRRRNAEAAGLTAAFAFGLLALHGASQIAPMMLERTALALLVFAAPLMGFALASVRPRTLAIGLSALVVVVWTDGSMRRAAATATEGFGEDWRGAVAALSASAMPGDIILLGMAPALGAVPLLAPGAAAHLEQRVVRDPRDRLDAALVATTGFGSWFEPAEACGRTVWAIGRDLDFAQRIAPLALPPPSQEASFGRVLVHRIEMPACVRLGHSAGDAAV
jgi:mannosyltransferase